MGASSCLGPSLAFAKFHVRLRMTFDGSKVIRGVSRRAKGELGNEAMHSQSCYMVGYSYNTL